MKLLFTIFVFLLSVVANLCNGQTRIIKFDPHLNDINTIVIGDINKDKIIDTAFVVGPKWINEEEDWINPKLSPYDITVYFSFTANYIIVNNAVTGFVESIGDINEDGYDEIVIAPGWFIGCYRTIGFYTFTSNKWQYTGNGQSNICETDSYKPLIKKINRKKFRFIEYVWDDASADRILKAKTIRIKV